MKHRNQSMPATLLGQGCLVEAPIINGVRYNVRLGEIEGDEATFIGIRFREPNDDPRLACWVVESDTQGWRMFTDAWVNPVSVEMPGEDSAMAQIEALHRLRIWALRKEIELLRGGNGGGFKGQESPR